MKINSLKYLGESKTCAGLWGWFANVSPAALLGCCCLTTSLWGGVGYRERWFPDVPSLSVGPYAARVQWAPATSTDLPYVPGVPSSPWSLGVTAARDGLQSQGPVTGTLAALLLIHVKKVNRWSAASTTGVTGHSDTDKCHRIRVSQTGRSWQPPSLTALFSQET